MQTVSFVSGRSIVERLVPSSSPIIALRASGTVYEAKFRGDDDAEYIHDYVLYKIL